MRNFITVATLVVATLLLSQPAMAAYCGASADTQTVQTGTITYFNAHRHASWKKIDSTYIMAIVVLGTYAQADVSFAGQASYYWIKKRGVWTFAGTFAPKLWPASVTSKLSTLSNQRANGSKQCTNPNFLPRGSG